MWNKHFALLCVANFAFCTAVAFLSLLPLYLVSIGLGDQEIGVIVGLIALAAIAGRLLSGWAIDRIGAPRFILLGALVWMLTPPAMVLSTSMPLLVLYRVVQGLGVGVFTNATLGYVAYITPERQRGAGVSWWFLTYSVAAIAGPLVADGLARRWGFPVMFGGAAVCAMVAAAIGILLPQITTPAQPGAPGVRRNMLFTPAAVVPGLFGAAVGVAFGGFSAFAPLRAQTIGFGNVGLYLTIYASATIAGQFLLGPLSDRRGRGWVILPGLLLMTVGMVLLGLIDQASLALIAPILFGLGIGGARPALTAWAVDRGGSNERTVASSTFTAIYEVGFFCGATALGRIQESSAMLGFLFVSVVLAFACAAYALLLWQAASTAPEAI